MIYNAEERKSLENSVAAIKRAELATAGREDDELTKAADALRERVFARRKDWKELKKGREKLEKMLEKKQKVPDKVPLMAR